MLSLFVDQAVSCPWLNRSFGVDVVVLSISKSTSLIRDGVLDDTPESLMLSVHFEVVSSDSFEFLKAV